MRTRLPAAAIALGVIAALLCGCGLGAGPAPGGVRLTVTREFGSRQVKPRDGLHVRGQETIMSLLMRNFTVGTRYGGGFVESIDGHSGGSAGGEPIDWFYYVNGVEAAQGAAQTTVHRGDVIWWDLHDWSQAQEVPAVVGSFPEPFLHGVEGKRLPVRLECAQIQGAACRAVEKRLSAIGVPAAIAPLGPAGEVPDTLRVLVGPWSAVRRAPAAQQLEQGPGVSGVYARPQAAGASLQLLDQRGRAARTLGAGAGLIAATRYSGEQPVWVVSGTDGSGVQRAAKAFDRSALADRFAVALEPAGAVIPLPVRSG